MADLNPVEKRVFERLFAMSEGFVYDFSNRTFQGFVLDATGIDVSSERYAAGGKSKANRLRTFWTLESNDTVARLLEELVAYQPLQLVDYDDSEKELEMLRARAAQIISRLREGTDVEDIDALDGEQDSAFEVLSRQIHESVSQGRPEESLDRLHTYLMRYARAVCDTHGIIYEKKTPLHGLFGSYVRFLRQNGYVQSRATLRILSSSVKVLDDLNKVRNEHSLAHDNELLDRNEATLIFRNISSSVKFIKGLEERIQQQAEECGSAWAEPEFTDEELEAAGEQWIQEQIDIARGK